MRNETALGSAFQRAGFLARETRFAMALAEFVNNGGSVARAHEIVDAAAEKMGSEGRCMGAGEAADPAPSSPRSINQDRSAVGYPPLPKNDDAKGQTLRSDKDGIGLPAASSPERNGAGHKVDADEAVARAPRPVSALYVAAAKAGAQKLATTVLDSFKVRDGRAIGDVRIGELETMRTANVREAAVLRQIQRLGYADANMTVRALVDHDTLAKMIQKAAELADAS